MCQGFSHNSSQYYASARNSLSYPGAKLRTLACYGTDRNKFKKVFGKLQKEEIPSYIKLSILGNISQGLEFLHGQNVVHSDLSSNKILLTKDFIAKISYLGMTKFIIKYGST